MSIFNEIKSFSRELEKVLRIDIDDYDYPGGNHIQWHTTNCVIYLVNRCHNSWNYLLEASAKDPGSYYDQYIETWDLTNYMQYIENWHYRFRGTSTENLPFKDIRDNILKTVKAEYINKTIRVYRRNGFSIEPHNLSSHDNNIIEKIESRFDILDL